MSYACYCEKFLWPLSGHLTPVMQLHVTYWPALICSGGYDWPSWGFLALMGSYMLLLLVCLAHVRSALNGLDGSEWLWLTLLDLNGPNYFCFSDWSQLALTCPYWLLLALIGFYWLQLALTGSNWLLLALISFSLTWLAVIRSWWALMCLDWP